jgi:predicted CXXCH cytochrome family protein
MKIAVKAFISSLLLAAGTQVFAVEHPGTIPKGAECSSCHQDKLAGKSVHSIMEAPCTVCHLMQTENDRTIVGLAMTREQLCSACHVNTVMAQQHSRPLKGECLDCHDAHNSNRRVLLLPNVADVSVSTKKARNGHPASLAKVANRATQAPSSQTIRAAR